MSSELEEALSGWIAPYEIVSVDFSGEKIRITYIEPDGNNTFVSKFVVLDVDRSAVAPESTNEAIQSICEVIDAATFEFRRPQ